MRGKTVVGTRLHWQSHTQHERIDVERLLGQLREFCARAATYADGGILIAVGLPAATTATMTGAPASGAVDSISPISSKTTSVFVDSVREFMARLQKEAASGAIAGKVEIIPLLFWGKFVPALNSLIGIATDQCPEADILLLQSLEIEVDAPGVALLRSNLDLGHDLVVGAALPGHTFQPDPAVQPLELSGLTSPWNTLALWNLQQLTKIGFALMGDALRLEVEGIGPAGGDEEVSSISMYQQLFTNTPAPTRAKLIRVPGVVWQVADFKDPERVAWHAMKMRSKKQRTAVQMAHFGGVAPGRVNSPCRLQYRFAESQLIQIDHCILLIFFVHGSNLRHCDRHYSNKYGTIQRPLEAKQQTTLRQQQRMNSGDGIQTRAASLRQEATRRWLVKDELVLLLLHHKLVGVPILHSLQLRPPSGSLLFYNTLKISDYKKDGWHWQKRKDKSGRVREDRAKLVINREVIILGTYVHSAETSTFHRRIYSVRDSKESIVLVHYFDEVNKEPVSVIAEDEEGLNKLQAAMELMGPEERQSLEDEVKVLQHGIRAWLLKRNCKNMRETTKQLREATQSIEDQQKQEAAEHNSLDLSERERAAVTVQAATRSMLARRSFLQTKHVAIKFQAATRGVLCRKNFARMKAHALASLVIQRNVREWWNKQPAATRIDKEADDQEQDTEGEKTPIPGDAYERALHDEAQRSQ
ncbi:hypothetical protein JG688_00001188 [Phytophthora aleatoria]|uniref:CG-1 domain-containing protein n=1 Tax=Phytophthora aleatoria TaxID=2496075 RepID=A0A8J5J0C9_9STRA|nr:hypothetical protein JG688_00001188 [Phytophthora aleatoria]